MKRQHQAQLQQIESVKIKYNECTNVHLVCQRPNGVAVYLSLSLLIENWREI